MDLIQLCNSQGKEYREHTLLVLQDTSQSSFLFFSAYSKIVTLGKDEFHLHLVDTAGQVPVGVGYPNMAVQP